MERVSNVKFLMPIKPSYNSFRHLIGMDRQTDGQRDMEMFSSVGVDTSRMALTACFKMKQPFLSAKL